MRRKKRKYVPITGERAIKMVSRVRTRNNVLWMRLLALAVRVKPREAKAIIKQIAENDQEVTKWLARI